MLEKLDMGCNIKMLFLVLTFNKYDPISGIWIPLLLPN